MNLRISLVLICRTARHNTMKPAVLPFQPKYRVGHPENYLFLLSNKLFIGSKYQKNKLLKFEKNFTGNQTPLKESTRQTRVVHAPHALDAPNSFFQLYQRCTRHQYCIDMLQLHLLVCSVLCFWCQLSILSCFRIKLDNPAEFRPDAHTLLCRKLCKPDKNTRPNCPAQRSST